MTQYFHQSDYELFEKTNNFEQALINQIRISTDIIYMNLYPEMEKKLKFFKIISIESCKRAIPKLLEHEDICIMNLPVVSLFPYVSNINMERTTQPVCTKSERLPLFKFKLPIKEIIGNSELTEICIDMISGTYIKYIETKLFDDCLPQLIGIYVPFIFGKIDDNEIGIVTRFAQINKYTEYKPFPSFNYDEGPE